MGALGLSLLHISSATIAGGVCVVGKSQQGFAEGVPCNGWSAPESAPGFAEPDVAKPGEYLGCYKRSITVASVGVVPVLHGAGGRRGNVKRLTEQSRSRMVRTLGELTAPYRYMATLTVGAEYEKDGGVFKKDLDRFLVWFLKQQRADSECGGADSIFWFLEFQKRGAPHVHFFYTSRVPWMLAAAHWANCIRDPSVERVGTRFEKLRHGRKGALGYARKYASKVQQKDVPADYMSVGRFWGVRGDRAKAACSISRLSTDPGFRLIREIQGVLEAGVRAGLLRRLAWEYGEGAVYFPAGRGETLYSIGIGQQLDLLVMR